MPRHDHLEADLETVFSNGIRQAGAVTWKMVPIEAGIPDRFVAHHGRIDLVELKKDGGRLSNIQVHQHGRLAKQGVTVIVLTGKAEILSWIAQLG